MSKPATVVQQLLRYIEGEGVEYIFGIPGGPVMPLYEAIFDRGGVKSIIAKHEQGAAFMADGYARVKGGLGVCCTTTGPGGTNALTGIACSAADSVPVLLITAQIATVAFGKGAAQESTSYGIDLVALYRPVAKDSLMLVNPVSVSEVARHCLRSALSGRPGPVHLNIPADLMKKEVQLDRVEPARYRASSEIFDRAAVQEAARKLVRARRPALLVGHGVAMSGAFEALRRLAERLSIPVATTPKAKGAIPDDHSLSLGVFGFAGSPQSEAYLLSGDIDVLVTVGTSLGELATHAWSPKLMPSGCLIQIDSDPMEIGKNYPAQLPVLGDAKTVLTEIGFQIEREMRWKETDSSRMRDVNWVHRLRTDQPRMVEAQTLEDDSLPLKPQRVMRELREALPDDAIVFVDIGNCMAWALHYFPVYTPGSFHINLGFASMGHSIPAAIGGQLAAPDKPVVAIVGDAAFAMTGMEIHTAVEYDVPVVWIVLNNGGHGMVHHGERVLYKGKFSNAKFKQPLDVAAMARAMGATAFTVDAPGGLAAILPHVLKLRRPTVIDARIDIEAVPPMALRIETLDKFFQVSDPVPTHPPTILAVPASSDTVG